MEALRQHLPPGITPPGLADTQADIPGYSLISQLMLAAFGFDVSNIMSFYLLIFGLYQAGLYAYNWGRGHFIDFNTSAVQIDDNDDLYTTFIAWISAQRMTELSRDLKASSRRPRAMNEDDSDFDTDESDVLDEAGNFSYSKWSGHKPVFYEPNFGDDQFVYEDRRFDFSKEQTENKYTKRWEKYVVIRCTGRSTQPIKRLIKHVKDWSSDKHNRNTSIYRSAKDRWDGWQWDCQAIRPSRLMSTVSLDEVQKTRIVADINDYLHPTTARWYAARGIPHRRGYLFHGPPGTGKTSLSFALAGIFGLNIYCASLCEKSLEESDLAKLFTSLPGRCIVLLEDIDSAGIRRDKSKALKVEDSVADSGADVNDETNESVSTKKTKRKKKISLRSRFTGVAETVKGVSAQSNITLAGLLNIIDGAASHEGRVLIMTTNYPEKLDSALIRPGRVDLQINFTLATREQIRDIFRRMYSTDHDVKPESKDSTTAKDTGSAAQSGSRTCRCCQNGSSSGSGTQKMVILSPERLTEMAKKFASQLPEAELSPAEVQGYLLMKKTDPEGALAGVKKWKDKMLEAKKKAKKVLDVQ
ncbi:P-loop containing nucleoside triphosphate hydrolase protein [Setomelanomma holmii]|uniref:P-loop containing nucleoside triphosphate hydrolase protein n=1 Tax=Setomelanomma holmii TaxID=210430 RepID=A0A9P4GZ66_9PLEO|nr:P-loop containing nucleoside triphosphate hydrolase protein [Setomelanomma holmii]